MSYITAAVRQASFVIAPAHKNQLNIINWAGYIKCVQDSKHTQFQLENASLCLKYYSYAVCLSKANILSSVNCLFYPHVHNNHKINNGHCII